MVVLLVQFLLIRTNTLNSFDLILGRNIGSNATNTEIVEYLLENKICGLARQRAEFGPRALGNRSLIADPRGKDIKDRVNEIKKRESFRPFAPSILEEFAGEYFEMPSEKSPYMQVLQNVEDQISILQSFM